MSARKRRALGGRDGFTLMEVLVAFAVLAIFMVALQRGLVVSRAGSGATVATTEAQQVARTLLESPVPKQLENPSRLTGRLGGHDWSMVSEPIDLPLPRPPEKKDDRKPPGAPNADGAEPGAAGDQPNPDGADKPEPLWRPLRITIAVNVDPRRVLTVETVRLVRMQPPPGGQ